MIGRAVLYFQTLRYVKPTQLYHQVYYRVKNKISKHVYEEVPEDVSLLNLLEGIKNPDSWVETKRFNFLNLEKEFDEIDWNFADYGKLWTYNLNYFEFLNQENITKKQGLDLIRDFLSNKKDLKDGIEPYPISLRGINWIKFLSANKISDPTIDKDLFNDYQRLIANLEYHLLANHLLENGFSLLFGAYYFQDERLYVKAKKILHSELNEQILQDGGHYELSPMYHQIIIHRILDSYNLVKNNSWKNQELLSLLEDKAQRMLGWLQEISFADGSIPKINDSADGIAPTTKKLQDYASGLGLNSDIQKLSDSGYRKFKNSDFEVILDVGQIAPSYQPGHSHADSLHFLLNYKGKPVIVDTGISTYEKNVRRQLQRSTVSHNTVTINDKNSSKVWGGFRVAERAKVKVLKDIPSEIEAQHNGYISEGIIHNRKFSIQPGSFHIEDHVLDKSHQDFEAKGHLHFHPDVQVEIDQNLILINKRLKVEISGADHIELQDYDFAEGFNKLKPAKKITYKFEKKVKMVIEPLVLDSISTSAFAQVKIPPTDALH